MNIIPAIDIKDGKCVRLFKGDFEQSTEYSANPREIGERFSAMAVTDLHVVDLDGAQQGQQTNQAIVAAIASESHLSVQLGGGIRHRDDIARWIKLGVHRCVVGSAAILEPDSVLAWMQEFGAERVVLALDVRIDPDGAPLLATHGWTSTSDTTLWDCLALYPDVQHVLCTDISRDGAMTGPNVALYREMLGRFPTLQLQASGGVRNVADLEALAAIGCPAAITGRALLDNKISAAEVAAFQRDA